MRKATPEQKAKAAERRERFRKLVRQVANMPEDQRLKLVENVGIMTCEGRALSLTNTMLIVLQNPKATVVGGFRQWFKQGRAVCKGEHGMALWVPIGHKEADPDTGLEHVTDEVNFIIGTVFDVSQTQEVQTT